MDASVPPAGGERGAAKRSSLSRWHRLVYLLLAFAVFTVALSLYLSHQFLRIEVRRLARDLQPNVLDAPGLTAALERYAADSTRQNGLAVEVQAPDFAPARLPNLSRPDHGQARSASPGGGGPLRAEDGNPRAGDG